MTTTAGTTRTTAQTLALIIGAVYVLVGILGFFFETQITGNTNSLLLGIFEINGLHNIVHLLIGVAGVLMSRTVAGARSYGLALLVVYGLTFLYGIFSGDNESILSLNLADDILHLVSAIAGGAIYAMSRR